MIFRARILFGIGLALFLGACQSRTATAPAVAPQRIITLTPALTEIVFALGAGEQIVGNTN